eukprot:GHVP01058767.1.p1 GENE.GHVP01058767.1~~GHVP01058767.1.p1  ORF type:complete len:102 (-),score=32.68 GHVP01058767.1:74-379(-)
MVLSQSGEEPSWYSAVPLMENQNEELSPEILPIENSEAPKRSLLLEDVTKLKVDADDELEVSAIASTPRGLSFGSENFKVEDKLENAQIHLDTQPNFPPQE